MKNNKYFDWLINSKLVIGILYKSKRLILPGFDKLPLFDVAVFFIKGLQKGYLTSRAAATSFNFFLAIFPAILFFFTIIPYLPIPHLYENIMSLLSEVLPQSTFDTIQDTVQDIINRKRGGLLSIGFLLTIYFSTNGISSLIVAFNQTYHAREVRGFFKIQLISILLVLLSSLFIIIAIVLILAGTFGLNLLVKYELIQGDFIYYSIQLLRWIIILSMIFFMISFIYFLAPAKSQRFRFISAGSTLATLLSLVTVLGFDFYVNNFSRYNALYGSIGTLIVMLLWIYFNAIILLIGFELNASIQSAGNDLEKFRSQENNLSDKL